MLAKPPVDKGNALRQESIGLQREFFIWSASKRSPKEFGGQGNGLSQKLALRKGLTAERQADQNLCGLCVLGGQKIRVGLCLLVANFLCAIREICGYFSLCLSVFVANCPQRYQRPLHKES